MNFLPYLRNLWHGEEKPDAIIAAYAHTFSTPSGQIVLEHLVNNVYATVCESNDALVLAAHNGRRSVVQDILVNIDVARNPARATTKVETVDPDRKAA